MHPFWHSTTYTCPPETKIKREWMSLPLSENFEFLLMTDFVLFCLEINRRQPLWGLVRSTDYAWFSRSNANMCDSVVGSEAAEPVQTTCKFTLCFAKSKSLLFSSGSSGRIKGAKKHEIYEYYGLFTLPDLDSDLDSKPHGYIVLFRTFHIGSDLDPDPYSEWDGFPNGYCIHFRDRSLSKGKIYVPTTYNVNKPLRAFHSKLKKFKCSSALPKFSDLLKNDKIYLTFCRVSNQSIPMFFL